jgi:ketosteroid isomerase-like protein
MKNKILLTVVLIFGLGLSSVFAQEWSPAQKEIWKNVNTYWGLMAKGDIAGFMEYFHPDYVGWDVSDPLPTSSEDTKKMMQVMYQGVKIPVFILKPLAIKTYGDVAFVHYNYTMVKESPDGKKNVEMGNWTDILLKQGSKWVMIGDHGGAMKKD